MIHPKGILWVGKKPVGNYLAKMMEWFKTESKVKVVYLDSTSSAANHIFTLMENGGFAISKEEKEEQKYTKKVLMVDAEKSTDGKPITIEYFPWNEGVRLTGTIKDEFKFLANDVIKSGREVICNRTVKWRFVYKR